MIKIRPITAQINTQKFISNFSSLLAKSWRGERPKLLLGGRWGPQLPLHTPGTCSSLSQCGLSPGPLLPRDSHHHLAGPLCRGVSSPTRGLLHRWGGGPGEAWDGDGNFSALLFFFFLPCWTQRIQQREKCRIPRTPDAPLEGWEGQRINEGGEGDPGSGTEFSRCLSVRSVQGNAAPLEREGVWKR